MADVLNFKRKIGNSDELSFMRLDDETLSFKHTSEGSVELEPVVQKETLSNAVEARKYKALDWSNQELANLFRVKHLLDAAGVICEIDRGLTDEGDPWFVFCQSDGEVFIHLCRIDGKYILDNPNIERPLSGYDFTDLISDFTHLRSLNEHVSNVSDDVTHRVVHLKRGGKVRLHPSALLAALVWSLYLSAEDLVLIRPDVDEANIGDADDPLISFDFPQDSTLEPLTIQTHQAVDVIMNFNHEISQDDVIRFDGFLLSSKDLQGPNIVTISPMGYAFGLSSIAIAFGFLSEERFSDNHNAILTRLNDALAVFNQNDEIAVQSNDLPGESSIRLDSIIKFLTELQVHKSFDVFANDDPSHSDTVDIQLSSNPELLDDLLAQTEVFTSVEQSDQVALKDSDREDIVAFNSYDHGIHYDHDSVDGNSVSYLANSEKKIHISVKAAEITTLIQTWDAPLQTFYIGDEHVRASFDISAIKLLEDNLSFTTTNSEIDQAGSSGTENLFDATSNYLQSNSIIAVEVGVSFQDVIQNVFNFDHSESLSFDSRAKDFVKSFMAKDDDIEIIVRGDDMIFIDMSGFYKNAANSTPYYIMSWELNGGGTIATVGLQPDFDHFDTVA